jgi:SAM-dependent methyltransferase
MTTSTVAPGIDAALLAYYTDHCDEAARLTATIRGRLEAVRIREILGRYLPPPPARVADVGGGPGVHALWLQQAGHTVDLVDPVPRHVEAARAAGVRSAVLGDARSLPFADASYDLVLLAGPVYHLPPAGRAAALREAARVTMPDGVVAAVGVNRYANLFGAAIANQVDERRGVLDDILRTGFSARNDRVPQMYYHSPDELAAELGAAGLADVELVGLTGPGGWLTVALDRHFLETGTPLPATLTAPDPLGTALTAARDADAIPALTAASAQLMAIGHRG